jgi:hypothetical protein
MAKLRYFEEQKTMPMPTMGLQLIDFDIYWL